RCRRLWVADQPGAAGMKLATSWSASTAATAISVGTPTAASAPDRPTDDTAVLPRGIGTSDASVDTMMLSDISVQKLIEPPNALMHAMYTAAYISALIALPPSSSATRRGERSASHNVAAAAFVGGTT